MEDKIMRESLTFSFTTKMSVQKQRNATNHMDRKWQVKEMEEDYECKRSTGFTGDKKCS